MRTNLKRQVFLFIFVIAGLIWSQMIPVYAAGTVTVTADKNSAQLNDSITVSVKTSEPEDPSTPPQLTVTYDPQLLTFQSCDVDYGGGEGGLITITGTSANLTFTAAKTGAAKVSAEAVIDEDGNNPATGDASIQIGAAEDSNLSSDATLRALSVNPGNMDPAFSPDVTDYTITIENSVTDITVSGGVTDPNAQITAASGFKNLKAGDNQAVITITAANGSTLTYHFKIVRGEAEQTEKPEDNKETENDSDVEDAQNTAGTETAATTLENGGYTISSTFDNSLLPEGFTKISFSYKGQSVDAASFETGSIILLYGSSTDGNGKFFIYDEGADSLSNFVQIKGNENHFIIPMAFNDKIPGGFKEEQLQWDDFYVPAGKLKEKGITNADAFYLLYAVNNDGNSGYYLYDVQEGTYQRFIDYGSSGSGLFSQLGNKNIIIMGVLIFLLVCSLMAILNLILKNHELAEDYSDENDELKTTRKVQTKKEQDKKVPLKKVKKHETEDDKSVSRSLKSEEQIAYELGLENDQDSETDFTSVRKPEQKPKAKKVVTPENTVKTTRSDASLKTPAPAKTPVKSPVKENNAPQVKREVTPQGITYTTGQIPITVVQPAKGKTPKAQVPIYTLERKPVSLTREAAPDELDDDFEFEFINIDNE